MLTVIVTITGGIYTVLAVVVTIRGRYIGSVSSYCDNNVKNGEGYM